MYKVSYISDGTTTDYTFVFPFFQNADVRVAVNNIDLTPEQYSVRPNESFTGGIITLQTAAPVSTSVDIYRSVSLSRVIDYQPTAKIDPETLNTDFNFLLAALQDLRGIDIDLGEWNNLHDNVMNFLNETRTIIEDKLSGGGVLGLYNNLLDVLSGALPTLVNDYGCITDAADVELSDDYGLL